MTLAAKQNHMLMGSPSPTIGGMVNSTNTGISGRLAVGADSVTRVINIPATKPLDAHTINRELKGTGEAIWNYLTENGYVTLETYYDNQLMAQVATVRVHMVHPSRDQERKIPPATDYNAKTINTPVGSVTIANGVISSINVTSGGYSTPANTAYAGVAVKPYDHIDPELIKQIQEQIQRMRLQSTQSTMAGDFGDLSNTRISQQPYVRGTTLEYNIPTNSISTDDALEKALNALAETVKTGRL